MELYEIISVAETNEAGVYVAKVDLTDTEGERYICDYVVRPDDDFGLAPVIRSAVGQWIADGKTVYPYTPPPPPTKQELSWYAAQKRYEKEVGGTIWTGWPVHTDRESQSKIIAERLAIEAGERSDPDGWKFADGVFRMVSNADFMALASAVRQHVRDCFTLEAVVLSQIEAGTITEYSQIDEAFDQEALHG